MPQTGPDLVGAGYPISRPLNALLGATGNVAQPNVPIKSNLDLGFGGLKDVSFASPAGSVYAVAVPVLPGDVISKVQFLVGGTGNASANVTNLWAALYTGTGSAPGTTGAQPAYIASAAYGSAAGSIALTASSPATFSFATPVTVTSAQAPYGYIYVAFSATTSSAAFSLVSMTCAAAAQYLYTPTSPVGAYITSNGGTGSTVVANIGTATKTADPPVCLVS